MNHQLITAPASEPITLAEVRHNLSLDTADTSKDSMIENIFIPAARKRIENYLGRVIITQTWKLTLDYFPDDIELMKNPVDSITSIKYYDSDNALQTLSPASYYLDNSGDMSRDWIVPAADTDWPDTYDRINAVEVTYVSGEATASEEIKICMHLMVGFFVNYPHLAESGISDTRQTNWIMRDNIGHLREIKI